MASEPYVRWPTDPYLVGLLESVFSGAKMINRGLETGDYSYVCLGMGMVYASVPEVYKRHSELEVANEFRPTPGE